jgi:hypothetical protein
MFCVLVIDCSWMLDQLTTVGSTEYCGIETCTHCVCTKGFVYMFVNHILYILALLSVFHNRHICILVQYTPLTTQGERLSYIIPEPVNPRCSPRRRPSKHQPCPLFEDKKKSKSLGPPCPVCSFSANCSNKLMNGSLSPSVFTLPFAECPPGVC